MQDGKDAQDKTLRERIETRIARKRSDDVFLPREFRDLGGIGSYARHQYDLYQLAGHPEVLAMLKSDEYGHMKADYDEISRTHFAKNYFHLREA